MATCLFFYVLIINSIFFIIKGQKKADISEISEMILFVSAGWRGGSMSE